MKNSEDKSLRRVYRQTIELDEVTREELLILAEAHNTLRNLAIEQARMWLAMEKDDPDKKPVTAFSLNYWLTPLRQENPALSEAVNAADLLLSHARQTLVYVAGAYGSFFELKKRGDGRARSPKTYQWPVEIPLSWPADAVGLKHGRLFVKGRSDGPRLEIQLPAYLLREIEGKKLAYVRLKPEGRTWWLELTVTFPAPPLREVKRVLAIDVGAGYVALASSCGKTAIIPNRRPDKLAKKMVGAIEKRQDGRTKGSRGYKRLAKARKSLLGQVEDRQKDFQRKLAHALLAEAEVIIVGQSKVRLGLAQSATGTGKQHWGSQNTGYLARFTQFLEIEAAETGGQVLKLPDPLREGALEEPATKLRAAEQLLAEGVKKYGLPFPQSFQNVHWRFSQ